MRVREVLHHGHERHDLSHDLPDDPSTADVAAMLARSPYAYRPADDLLARLADDLTTTGRACWGWSTYSTA